MHRVVLDAVAVADLLDHLQVVLRAHAQPLRLEQLALALEERQPLLQLGLDADDGLAHPLVAGDVVGGREDDDLGQLVELLAGERVDDGEPLDRVAEHLDAQHRLVVRGVHLDGVAPHPELAPAERHVVAVVLQVDQAAQDRALVVVDPGVQLEQLAPVLGRVAHAVDARDRRDDDGVPPGEQRGGGRVAQPVDLVVDRRVLLDVGVARGDVGLGLVVVVVADEVLDPVLGEELLHLGGELRGEALVRREDQRRALHRLDRPGDGGALAGAGDAEQGLEPVAPLDPLGQLRRWPPAGRRRARTWTGL